MIDRTMAKKWQAKRWQWLHLALVCSLLTAGILSAWRPVAAQPPTDMLYGVTGSNRLIQFASTAPGTLIATRAIVGLEGGETVLGLDFRPADGRLYALGSTHRLYTINPQTGAASPVATEPFTATLTGTTVGFDFNPVPDRIRVVSDEGQNFRLHPVTGRTAGVDVTLAYTVTAPSATITPTIGAAAYTDNVSGTTTTTLYVIDTNLDILARQGGLNGPPSPNTGQLFTVGALNVDAAEPVGFDITPGGTAYAAITPEATTTTNLYTIDLATGAATSLGAIGGGETLVALAAPTVPPAPLPAEPVYAVTSANRLIRFNSATPGTLTASHPITGLQPNENLLGIDFRPADGRLYALGSTSRLYTLDLATGLATVVGTQPFTATLEGSAFGFDFNPVPDRIRVVSDEGQNLRLHPVTGTSPGVDASLAYTVTDPFSTTNPSIVAAAYTNNFSGTTATTLYVIDAALNTLARQGGVDGPPSPNSGQLFTIGALGVDATAITGFDISSAGNAFVATITPSATTSSFALVNLATGLLTTVGPIGGPDPVVGLAVPTKTPSPAAGQPIYAVTGANRLIRFNSATPGLLTGAQAITGLQAGENVLGIDFRPATGQLYALGSTSRLYTINPATGVATLVGTQPFTSTLDGTAFGFDFNPVPDRIRVTSDTGQNLRLHPVTGRTAGVDATLAYTVTDVNAGIAPAIVAAAYTDNFSGTTRTTLYVIDATLDTLALQGGPGGSPSPNGGRLFTVGALGVDATTLVGFDIAPDGAAFAATTAPSATTSSLATVNLTTGQLTPVGTIGGGETIVGLAVPNGVLPATPAEPIYAVTTSNRLISFSSATPGTVLSSQPISNLLAGDTLVGIDFRPADGQLYALGRANRVYTINPANGQATLVGSAPFTSTLNGSRFGVDFNPVPDRIRVTSDAGQNLRLHPVTGGTAGVDVTLAYTVTDLNAGATPALVAVGYTNNMTGAAKTTLYGIDANLGVLVLQGGPDGVPSPNTGRLFTVGSLGVSEGVWTALDISPSGVAYATLTAPNSTTTSNFYVIDLASGKAKLVGPIGGGEAVSGVSTPTRPPLLVLRYLPLLMNDN
jgi:hypothetical protein